MLSSKLLKKLVLTALLAGSSSVIAKVVSAQSFFYYPSASFFSPQAYMFESSDLDVDLAELLEGEQFATFTTNLQAANLADPLKQKETLTVLAPTEEAFAALSPEIKEKLSDPETLEKVLKYHLVVGDIDEDDIKRRGVLTMLEENAVAISGVEGENEDDFTVMLNDATASEPVFASNGAVIPIDKVLIPANL